VSDSRHCKNVTDVIRLNSYMVLGVTIKRKLIPTSDRSEADPQSTRNHLKQMNCATFLMSSLAEHPTNKAKCPNHSSRKN
jgi:hypothetical protein